MSSEMLTIDIQRNNLGLFEANATLELPPITVSRCKADRDDLKYDLRRAFSELVEEIVEKQMKDEF